MKLPTLQQLLLGVVMSLLTSKSFGQTVQNQKDRFQSTPQIEHESLTLRDLYNIEYKLVDESQLGDSTILLQMNPLTLDYFRRDSEDFILHYKGLDFDVLIFSRDRISEEKKTRSEHSITD